MTSRRSRARSSPDRRRGQREALVLVRSRHRADGGTRERGVPTDTDEKGQGNVFVPRLGVGIQYNPEILEWFPFEEQEVDAMEVLLDVFMGPLDSPYVVLPGKGRLLDRLRAQYPLLSHSNYGCEFGFEPLDASPAMLRHVPIARALRSPWVSDHCLYGDASFCDLWSSPLQFSAAEVQRASARARALQEAYGIPLAHENAAYYRPCPGAELREAEFLARLVESSGTYLHLDLHNIHTNSVNLPGYDIDDFLSTIPLDRVIEVHIAGGSWHDGLYHDWHDSKVPEPVWELLDRVLRVSNPGAVVLEFQGRAHHPSTRVLGREEDLAMIQGDLERAKAIWDRTYGPGSRLTTSRQRPHEREGHLGSVAENPARAGACGKAV
jgi:uncharacterized protein